MTIAAASSRNVLVNDRVFGEPQLHTDGELLALAYAPDGTLWSVEDPGLLRHWNAQTGQQIEWHALSDLETLWNFTRDSRILISASDDLSFWDVSSGQVLTAVPLPSWATSLACHADPSHVATGHDDGVVRHWDAAGHQLVCEMPGGPAVSCLAFSPDGSILAAAYEDRTISLWDATSGKRLGKLEGHKDRIPAMVWHPNGQFLVSAGWDTTARVWDVQKQEAVILLNSHVGQVTAAAFNREGSLLACSDSALLVHVWDFVARKEKRVLKGPKCEVHCLAFAPDGKRLASGGDHVIHLWDAPTGVPLAGTHARQVSKTIVAVSPEGTHIASNNGGLSSKIFNVKTRRPERTLEERQPVHDLAWSRTGNLLAGACGNHVRLWHADTGKVKLDVAGPEEMVTNVALSLDGSLLAAASSTGQDVWLWRTDNGEPALLIPDALDGCAVQSLSFHPKLPIIAVGGIDWLATGGSNGAICLWDHQERCELATFNEGTTCLVVHPSGKRLASTSLDQSICIWDLNAKEILAELTGHDGPVVCLAYSPNGHWLASAGEDHTLRIWNDDGSELTCREIDSQPNSLAFSPDGKSLFTANANTTCYQFSVAELLR